MDDWEQLVSDFLKKNPPHSRRGRTSFLSPYKKEIEYLRKKGSSLEQIAEYLRSVRNVEVKRATLASFIRRHGNSSQNKKSNEIQEEKERNSHDKNSIKIQKEVHESPNPKLLHERQADEF